MKGMHIAPGLDFPVAAVTETFGIVGIRGSGKSTTAKVIVEGLTELGQQCVVVDPLGSWFGLKSSADGKSPGLPFTILGGARADVPITPTAGTVIADLVVESDAPLILDLSGMRKGEQRRFMTAFVEQLYHRSDGSKALHVVVDECDLYIPQRPIKGAEVLVGAMEDLVRRGRFKGLGVSLISQRPASIHKDVLSQVSVLVAHRLVGPQDRAALDAWVQAHGTPERRAEMMATLAGQATGQAWFWSPSWLDIFRQVTVRRPSTFDSSATPTAGVKRVEPKVATVDIDQLRERLGAIVAQAEADDPKVLRRRILELERDLTQARNGAPAEPVVVERVVEVEVIPASLEGEVWKVLMQFRSEIEKVAAAAVDEVMRRVKPARHVAQATAPAVARTAPANARNAAPKAANADPPPANARDRAQSRSEVKLKAGARRLLETVARHHPMRMSQSQVGTLAGFKVTGGTFGTYKSILRREGLIDIDGEGMWTATEAGRIEAGVAGAEPMSVDEVLDRWRSVLKLGARTMLDVLIDNYPKALSRSELAGLVDMAESGGTFGTYLSTLRRNGLINVDGSMITASDTLFVVAS